ALELCAAQIELFAPAQLLHQLRQSPLDLLANGAHDLPPQHRTLRQAIERSYQLLHEEEQTLLRSLGIFAGGFALAELAAVMGQGGETDECHMHDSMLVQLLYANLQSLIGKSLVRAETTATGEQRFLLLETIREFALEQLCAHGEDAEVRQHHYLAYLRLFRMGDSYLRGPEAATWMIRLESEQDYLRYALQWKLDTQQPIDAAWLLIAVHYFWYTSAQRYEAGQWLVKLLPYRFQLPINVRLMTLINFYGSALEL
ncbi:MAG: hypothetical protein KDE31_35600, partial [Caldilineaceae bacterium]|nr:hypothetical protein [Caldilineaceae bacterium]